ncbi:AfsR/SARP family transcriptional regulator [Actinoplanes aureus]|uniref:Tetratricopeptide repeat protein n=1 Tax=Actinoplanes aureus TaxID=2792083 RepID=A0A931CLI4_9ACTN|nr:BTAD domain-containing putative transcriptional regulator [Actinoplanes aureus]MBG0569226.1 tetratricopeptide repeat protein [Actinoplanes aureus]
MPAARGGVAPVSPQVRLAVLGSVRAWREEREIALRPPQARAVLAVLLARVGMPVSIPDVLDVVWGPSVPSAAVNAVHVHVRTLRRLLEPGLPTRDNGQWLIRGSGGYQLDGGQGQVDLVEFRRLVGQARTASDGASAVASFRSALQLWTGPIAGNIDAAVRSHALFREVERECLQAACEASDAALHAGHGLAVLDAIHTIADRDLLDESVQARLMLLLAAAGRQAQALERFELVRRTLAEDLGVDPGDELAAAQREVLRPATVLSLAPPAPVTAVRPAQLPADLPSFTGRVTELAAAMAMRPDGAAVRPLVTVVGMAGVGKTALAVHLAHEVASRYPDGQLFVNLRGFDPDGSLVDPSDALRGFLEAFEVTAAKMPRTLDGMVTMYRSLLAERRVLVVIDNARDAEHVRPLLPGSRSCLTVVTSRTMLSSLVVTNGAHPLPLQTMSDEDALEMLAHRVGRERIEAEPQAAAAIIRYCGGLPLALAVVAARAATGLALGLDAIVADLAATHGRLDAFAETEAVIDVRTVFSWSYHALSDEAARLFRLLGKTRVGPDIGLAAAASLAGVSIRDVRPLLAELLQATLINRQGPNRYAMHDLIAAFAAEVAGDDGGPAHQAALHRLLDYYRLTALSAERLYYPGRSSIEVDRQPPPLEGPTDRDTAGAWFTAERLTLLAAVREVTVLGRADHACHMAWSLTPFLYQLGHWDDMRTVLADALTAGADVASTDVRAQISTELGMVLIELDLYEDAEPHLVNAHALFGSLGDGYGQARVSWHLSYLCAQRDNLAEALVHATDALAYASAAEHRGAVAASLNNLAWIHVLDGDLALAVDDAERALAIFRELDRDDGIANSLDTLGHAHHKLGDFARANEYYLMALQVRRNQGARSHEALVLHRLGDNQQAAGKSAEAREFWRQALAIMEMIGSSDAEQLRRKLAAIDPGHSDHFTVHRR